jgi:ribonuclease HI
LPFCISIAENKEYLAHKLENAVEEIQVFSDGSAQGSKVGAATILIKKDAPDHILHFHLGPETEHTVQEAELVGMLLALHLVATEQCNATSYLIAVDNQATLRAFDSDLRRLGHHLAREVLDLANCLQKCRGKRKFNLVIKWAAGHCGIVGNEKADREAKKAANRTTSLTKLLPPLLRKPLFINPSAAKRAYNDGLTRIWKEDWSHSERGKKMRSMDGTSPSTKFLNMISNSKLSREAASRIVQLRLQHAPLNSYLHHFKRIDKANCPACGANDKSIAHFLL